MTRTEYAVVGAGPAGSMAALALAERRRAVLLFDWRPRDEKPCGGGVPARGMDRFGALVTDVPRNEVASIRVVGPRREEAKIGLDRPLAIFARREFDEALRRRAVERGAERVAARVTAIERAAEGFELALRRDGAPRDERVHARFVIAADGAAGLARRRLAELAGWRVPGPEHFSRSLTTYPRHGRDGAPLAMVIAYVGGVDGYGWSFPRPDHASTGWCEQAAGAGAAGLRRVLERLLGEGALAGRASEPGIGALIPSYRAFAGPVEGERFAFAGDAAGAVDPLTREGIHHALESGARLGECDPLERPGRYGAWFERELRPELARAAQLAPTFFGPSFLTMTIRAIGRSEALREVFRDLVAGTQSYVTLKRRLLKALPRALPALALAALRR